MKKLIISLVLVVSSVLVFAQSDAEALKQSNNPLANIKSLNINNYYMPSLASDANASVNTTMIRYAQPIGKVLVRATLPVTTINSDTYQSSGISGFNIFGAYLLSDSNSPNQFGIGPMITAPTYAGYESIETGAFDNNAWSIGGAIVAFWGDNPVMQRGGLITYEHSLNADNGKEKNEMVIQPFLMLQLGKGTYLRSAGSMRFDFANDVYNVPVGIGIGKASKVGGKVFNFFFEPQYTAFTNDPNGARFQLYSGINMQF